LDQTIQIQTSAKKAILFGATGLVGTHCLQELLGHPAYHSVTCFYRSEVPSIEDPNFIGHQVDFEDMGSWATLIEGHDLFTTLKKAGSKNAFYHIEYEYITKIATIAEVNGIRQIFIVSAPGADSRGYLFYNQIKGMIEDKVKRMDFWSIHFLRPSVLLGSREEARPFEDLAAGAGLALKLISPKLFSNITPIEGHKVARCMVKVAQSTRSGVFYYPSSVIARLGKKD